MAIKSKLKRVYLYGTARIVLGLAATLVYTIVIWVGVSQLHPTAVTIVGVLLTVLATFLLTLPLIPGATAYLVNNPNRLQHLANEEGEYKADTFGVFTMLAPGQVKIVERGNRFIRCIMKFDNHTFVGAAKEDKGGNLVTYGTHEEEYWEVIKTPEGKDDFYPIPDKGFVSTINPIWWWARYVYTITGAVFTGIPPFQTVRVYPLERLQKKLNRDGSFSFTPKTDFSDHYRVADSQMFIEIPSADTKDKIPVTVQKVQTIRVINPYQTAYNTDQNWATRYFTAAADAINRFTRSQKLSSVLTVVSPKSAGKFGEAVVKQLNTSSEEDVLPTVSGFGILVIESAVLDITVTDEETRKKLKDEAIAIVDAKARVIRGKGEATATEALIDVVRKNGQAGSEVMRRETLVRAAEAAGKGGGTVILGDGGSKNTVSPEIAFLENSIRKGE